MTKGIGGRGLDGRVWAIVDLDRDEVIEGQFAPQGLTKNLSANVGHGSMLGADDPLTQWLSGSLKTVTFSGMFYADHAEDESIDARVARLERLVTRNDDLRRIPVCEFVVGETESLTMTCVVRSLGGMTYSENFPDGLTRGVSFQVTLEKFVEVRLRATDPTRPETFTRIRRAKAGDTYESIALDEYGDAELGIALRKRNPRNPGMALVDLDAKDPVHVFPDDHLREVGDEPVFHGLRSGSGYEPAEEARRDAFEARSSPGYTTIFATSEVR